MTVRKTDTQMNVAGIRRNIKNLAHNYSDAQVKVREATSNDPWGPSSTIMAEIADLTYNVVAFSEIMQMIWKRMNDHGKNWRHVYKALVSFARTSYPVHRLEKELDTNGPFFSFFASPFL